jgi:hypothetical protein
MPEEGAHILALYKGCKRGNYFEMTVREGEGLGHIEKWCYYDDYHTLMKRKILNEKDI